ncbi:MAG: hypothetical protein NC112_05010 [Oxalobacter formigenes]|nr:hypothetical protein [Oxalobacter formigenes]
MNEEKNNLPGTALPPVLTEKAAPGTPASFAKEPLVPVLTDILPKEEKKIPAAAQVLETLPWQELEERLIGRIHQQVTRRLEVVLDDSIARHTSTLLEKAVALLTEEVRNDMQKTLEAIVVHAISAELQRLRRKMPQEETPTSPNR